jgi:hypothetical protein
MTITNGYCTQVELKQMLGIPGSDAVDNTILDLAIESASRSIDEYTKRRFWADVAASARSYRCRNSDFVYVDDFQPSSGAYSVVVKSDDDNDGSFETTWTVTTDYVIEPVNTSTNYSIAQNMIVAVGGRSFPMLGNRSRLEVTAKWGWPAVPTAVKFSCLLIAEDLFKSKDAPFGVAGFGDMGVLRVRANPKAMELLDPFRLPPEIG